MVMVSTAGLPLPSTKRVAVRVTPDALRHVTAGHPWIYDHSITSVSHEGASGDLAVVFDRHREFAAIGLYDPASPIRIKVLHHGRPAAIDETFWSGRLAAALARRDPLVARGDTTGYRCVNGENDGLPGLVLDRYADTYVLKLYTAAWTPHLATIVPVIAALVRPERIVVRLARNVRERVRTMTNGLIDEGVTLAGDPPTAPVEFLEHGLHFEADVALGQKTGHFLDQRDNRALVGINSSGCTVLDVFACTGGFSVHAAAGGATRVVSLDASAPALAMARRNMAHNDALTAVRSCLHDTVVGDAFEVMDRLAREGQQFDVVVVDPPSFAQRRTSIERGLHAYQQLTERAVRLTADGGMLLQASCSSRIPAADFFEAVHRAARSAKCALVEVARTGHSIDHPVSFPEGAYLKALLATVQSR